MKCEKSSHAHGGGGGEAAHSASERAPQSVQSVHAAQMLNSLPLPPSSHASSDANAQILRQLWPGGIGCGGGLGGGGDGMLLDHDSHGGGNGGGGDAASD